MKIKKKFKPVIGNTSCLMKNVNVTVMTLLLWSSTVVSKYFG